MSQIEIRNDIADRMKQRSKYRRNRKARYRKESWLNRSQKSEKVARRKLEEELKDKKSIR